MKYSIIPFFSLLSVLVYSQAETVTITDSSPPSSLKFDQSFKIVYTPIGKHKASGVFLIELDKCGCMVPFDCCNCKTDNFCNKCNDRVCDSLKHAAKKKLSPQNIESNPLTVDSILSKERIDGLNTIINRNKIDILDRNRVKPGILSPEIIKKMEEAFEVDSTALAANTPASCLMAIKPYFTQPDSGAVNVSIPALRPNKRFMLVVTWQGKPVGIDDVLDLLIKKPNKAEAAYNKVVKSSEFIADNGVACSGCKPHFRILPFSDFVSFAKTDLMKTLYLIQLTEADIKTKKKKNIKLNEVLKPFDLSLVSSLIQFSQECLQCQDTIWQQSWINNNRLEFSRTLVNLPLLRDTLIAFGYSSINEANTTNPKSEVELAKRIANIEKTIKWTSTAHEFIRYYAIKKYGAFTPPASILITDLKAAIDVLWGNHKLLVDHKKTIDELSSELKRLNTSKDKILSNWEGFTQAYASTTASTFSYNFDTRAGFYIQSDFGFMGFNDNNKIGFAPFLGFHVNFRPMNTDVPYKNILCKGWGILSFNSGLLLGSFKKENERTGIIGNNAIYTGLGVALNHGVRITTGTVWYKQKDLSPLKSDYRTKASFYLGVAIDIRLKNIYDSFKNIFTP